MNKDLDQQLAALDEETLTPVVPKAIREDSAAVLDWSFDLLSGEAINPITAGIYKFHGNARCNSQIIPWSLILKVSQWVDFTDFPPLQKDYLDKPEDWNYWKREALVAQSDIFRNWDGDLMPVKYLAVSQPTGTTAWIWQMRPESWHLSFELHSDRYKVPPYSDGANENS